MRNLVALEFTIAIRMSPQMTWMGTRPPLAMIAWHCWPVELWLATSARSTSPDERCVNPCCKTSCWQAVPLPEPGPPMMKTTSQSSSATSGLFPWGFIAVGLVISTNPSIARDTISNTSSTGGTEEMTNASLRPAYISTTGTASVMWRWYRCMMASVLSSMRPCPRPRHRLSITSWGQSREMTRAGVPIFSSKDAACSRVLGNPSMRNFLVPWSTHARSMAPRTIPTMIAVGSRSPLAITFSAIFPRCDPSATSLRSRSPEDRCTHA
mmetsp:Transcript_24896/g.78816  ORF Transcript_24896/g.78816 Transcript_24896/m.78816 type:complete len:267 (-) Transcript_24896:331-1131(-)